MRPLAKNPSWSERCAEFVSRRHEQYVFRKIAGVCRRYLSWYGNLNYDVASNGERFVLDCFGALGADVLFDVGANIGEWSVLAHHACPSAKIHAFEIVPTTFEKLTANTQALSNVHRVNLGLSDTPGSIEVHHYADVPSLSTAIAYPHPFPSTSVTCSLTTGDIYAASSNIAKIDLLKIDVEGMEDKVLKGFAHMFREGRIRAVQFEYGRVNILSKFLLRDFYDFFREHGYILGKIYPDHIDFRSYELPDEDFMGPNYLVCQSDDQQLIKMLRKPRPERALVAGVVA